MPPLTGASCAPLAEANPELMRVGVVADAVGEVMGGRPDQPRGTDPTPVEFVIEPGQSSSARSPMQLVDRDLVTDRLAFTWVLASDDGLTTGCSPGRTTSTGP